MALSWVRLDTGLPDHPKILALLEAGKHRAVLGYVFSLAWSGRHETDGFVPNLALKFIHMTPKDAVLLVEMRLWHHVEGGFQINSWDEHQPVSSSSQARVSSLKRAARKGGCVKNHGENCGCWRVDATDSGALKALP